MFPEIFRERQESSRKYSMSHTGILNQLCVVLEQEILLFYEIKSCFSNIYVIFDCKPFVNSQRYIGYEILCEP